MKQLAVIIIFAIAAVSCGTSPQKEIKDETNPGSVQNHQQAFLNNLASLCGKSFTGRESYSRPGRSSWADKKFVMHVTVCDSNRVYIPFHLDNDHSRTWQFTMEEQGLRFRHDHRHEDGTPEDQTLYGGYAEGSGTPLVQTFPWDNYTKELLADGVERVWKVILADDLSTFTYQLHYGGELVFAAEFDLKNPLKSQE